MYSSYKLTDIKTKVNLAVKMLEEADKRGLTTEEKLPISFELTKLILDCLEHLNTMIEKIELSRRDTIRIFASNLTQTLKEEPNGEED